MIKIDSINVADALGLLNADVISKEEFRNMLGLSKQKRANKPKRRPVDVSVEVYDDEDYGKMLADENSVKMNPINWLNTCEHEHD